MFLRQTEIDWDALDSLESKLALWRKNYDKPLSSVFVPGEGDSPVAMIIGEAPGGQEEIARRPFVGPAGIALRSLMDMARLWAHRRDSDPNAGRPVNCWLTNVVKFRPPRNRTPLPSEIEGNRQFLVQEWNAIGRPRLIIAVGGVAYRAVSSRKASILRIAGRGYQFTSRHDDGPMMLWPMIHPSYGLRGSNRVRELIEADWVRLGRWLDDQMGQL